MGCARNFAAAPDARNVGPAGGRAVAGALAAAYPGRGGPGDGAGISAARALEDAVGPLAREAGGHVSVAVQDLATRKQASYGGTVAYDTASIEKADILATRLYQEQRAHRGLSPKERRQAYEMITRSDNTAASDLWADAGGTAGIDSANRKFGLRDTAAGHGPYWGLTETTADDQLRLLRQLLARPSVLTRAARNFAARLMSEVEPSQVWGISAAADPRTRIEIKNGWLPNPGLWVINSIGEIIHHRQPMLIAVLSDDNRSEASGISLVQDIAKRAAAAVSASRPVRP